MLRRIDEFCPPGMQIKSPGGLSFRLEDVSALVANGNAGEEELIIYLGRRNGLLQRDAHQISITFYRNTDDGPPEVYQLKRNIEEAINGKKSYT